MDHTSLLLIAGYCILICNHANGHSELNTTNPVGDESHLPNKERFRRLIPYMTFYLDQGYNTQSQYINQAPQNFQAVQPVHNNLQPQPYYVPQYQQQKVQLVPLGYLVGGGYRRTPVYSRPSQPDYHQRTYTPQHPSDLTRMITQNYHSMVKEVNDQTKDQRPAQYTTKLEYTKQNQPQNPAYKTSQSQTKAFFQPRHRFQPNHNRQPYVVKNYQPNYTPLKDDSYVQLHSNYDINSYETGSKVNNYEHDPNFMTITKSQEIKYSAADNSAPEPEQVPIPDSTPASLPQLESNYEQSIPTVTGGLPQLQSDYEPSIPTTPTEEQNNLLDILSSYQLSKVLPDKVTPSNIGYSIRTLSNILKLLEKAKAQTSEDFATTHGVDEESYGNGVGQSFSPYQTEGSTPGRAGVDYPAYAEIPETEFTCKSQRYKGFFADPDTNCQVWHYCDLNGGQASFLCPNGTIFSQVALTCDWWFNVKCAATAQQYVLNERLYKYILPVKPSFPEDYAGPLVDQYLTLKFQEIEAKKQNITTTEKTTSTLQVLLNDEINQSVK